MKNDVRYLHDEAVHNLSAPGEIVPVLMNLFRPGTVLDVGCGIGTWLKVFKAHHAKVFGVDGDYVNRQQLEAHISPEEFEPTDLATAFDLGRKFDLLICLEVAEHLPEAAAETFIDSLAKHSDRILFGAAMPHQWGQNHLNEQWPEWWMKKFRSRGYACYDLLRPLIWDNKKVDWWYKQNTLVFSREPIAGHTATEGSVALIHPEHFMQKIDYIEKISALHHESSASLGRWERGEQGVRKHWASFIAALKNKFKK